jgi:hypothetical protein
LLEKFYADQNVKVEKNVGLTKGNTKIDCLRTEKYQCRKFFLSIAANIVVGEEQSLVMGEMIIFFDSKNLGQ